MLQGGAITVTHGSLKIVDCTFTSNTAYAVSNTQCYVR